MDMPDATEMFSNPGDEAFVMAAWERFLSGEEAPHSVASHSAVRHLVDTSWQRCLDGQVDPTRGHAPPPLDEHLLYSLQRSHRDLVEASAPVMTHARDFLAQTETVMALAEPAGTILSLEGDPATIASARGIQLLPGASWNEMICGTNAIGTAIEVGQPVQIHSAEHFCAGIKRWTCSANAIRDPRDGTTIGVIDVSGLSESYNRHSLALVVTAASRIESRLAARTTELRYRLLDRCMSRLAMLASDGAVVFDHGGYPIKVNEHAEAAIAAAGGDLSLARPKRILALATDSALTGVTPTDLPHWIQPDWIEPVIDDGRRIGSLLIVPFAQRHSSARRASSASGRGAEGGSMAGFERIQGEARHVEALRRTGTCQPFEKEYIRKDGRRVPVIVGSAILEGSHETRLAFVLDLTERKRAEEQMQASQAELAHATRVTTLGELSASLAHEVGQPLTAIVTSGEACLRWLAHRTPQREEVQACVDHMIAEGRRASEIVQGIRSLTKRANPQTSRLELNDVVNDVVSLVQREVLYHRVSLRLQLAPALPPLLGDRIQLQQVIINFVMNGIQAMADIGDAPRELLIESRHDNGGNVVVAVRDSGTGIDPENAHRLFDAFFTTKSDGMGMGLSICRSIIEAHGGRVWASNNAGRGAIFQFSLPSIDESAS